MPFEPPAPLTPGVPPAPDYATYVRRVIEAGMADSGAGRTVPVEQVRAMFGLDP